MPKTVDLLYIGVARHHGKLAHAYASIGSVGELAERAHLMVEPLTDHPPGSHLRFESDDGRLPLLGTGLYVCAWPDKEAVVGWLATHDALVASELAFEQDPPPRLAEILDPLRAAYAQLGKHERGVLIAQVIQAIVGA